MNKKYCQETIEGLSKVLLNDKNKIAQDLEIKLKNKNDMYGIAYSNDKIYIQIEFKLKEGK